MGHFYPQVTSIPSTEVPTTRGGLLNTYYWIDPRRRIAAVFMTQTPRSSGTAAPPSRKHKKAYCPERFLPTVTQNRKPLLPYQGARWFCESELGALFAESAHRVTGVASLILLTDMMSRGLKGEKCSASGNKALLAANARRH